MGSGALHGKMLFVRIIENNKIDFRLGKVTVRFAHMVRKGTSIGFRRGRAPRTG